MSPTSPTGYEPYPAPTALCTFPTNPTQPHCPVPCPPTLRAPLPCTFPSNPTQPHCPVPSPPAVSGPTALYLPLQPYAAPLPCTFPTNPPQPHCPLYLPPPAPHRDRVAGAASAAPHLRSAGLRLSATVPSCSAAAQSRPAHRSAPLAHTTRPGPPGDGRYYVTTGQVPSNSRTPLCVSQVTAAP